MKKKYYLTTPIYYPSANFHIGHCYTTVIADAIARYKRLMDFDVFFLTGTDEHGQKIETKAQEAGKTPQEYVDAIVANAKDLWKALQISYDKFIRTTDEYHQKAVQKIFTKLYEQGDIYKGEYEGLYCTPCESFWTPTQLKDGKCPDCGREVHPVKEESYFFKLSKYQDQLVTYIEKHPDFILPESRKNEMINNFLKPGLEDLCVSRTTFKWGIPVSFDSQHVIYVWIDALSNYLTALGYGSSNEELFKRYWPADVHLVGKEIMRFHTIIWPAILMALGLKLPQKVFGHGWLIIDGGKISKSKGNYKDPRVYIKTYGVDAVRYYLLREVQFGNDGNFSENELIKRTNADLANVLGNLVYRTVSMSHRYFGGIIKNRTVNPPGAEELRQAGFELGAKIDLQMNNFRIADALDEIFELLRKCNKYIEDTAPWTLAKTEVKKAELETLLAILLDMIHIAAVYLQAFMPQTAAKILSQLNVKKATIASLTDVHQMGSYKLNKPEILFARIKDGF